MLKVANHEGFKVVSVGDLSDYLGIKKANIYNGLSRRKKLIEGKVFKTINLDGKRNNLLTAEAVKVVLKYNHRTVSAEQLEEVMSYFTEEVVVAEIEVEEVGEEELEAEISEIKEEIVEEINSIEALKNNIFEAISKFQDTNDFAVKEKEYLEKIAELEKELESLKKVLASVENFIKPFVGGLF